MGVSDRLDAFRESLSGCDLVVLADLSTETVLSSSADIAPSQEELDALTAEACATIVGPVGEGAAILLQGEPERPRLAIVAGAQATRVFVAPEGRGAEALLISLRPGSALDRIFDCAGDVLADILADS
jgi:hypothetical protein